MSIPIAAKNTPQKRVLIGFTYFETSRAYLVEAIIIPAMNAPINGDKPAKEDMYAKKSRGILPAVIHYLVISFS